MTELDRLCATIPFHDADPAQRALVLRQLADTELYVALARDPAGDRAELRMFDLPGGPVALACDDAAALAGFLGGPVAHLALPGLDVAAQAALSAHEADLRQRFLLRDFLDRRARVGRAGAVLSALGRPATLVPVARGILSDKLAARRPRPPSRIGRLLIEG